MYNFYRSCNIKIYLQILHILRFPVSYLFLKDGLSRQMNLIKLQHCMNYPDLSSSF